MTPEHLRRVVHRRRRRLHRQPLRPHACSADPATEAVTVYDNFSSGQDWHLAEVRDDARLEVVRGEVEDLADLRRPHAA